MSSRARFFCYILAKVRILLDYRPALHERTGVGEFVHELARALVRRGSDEVRLISTSWKHSPSSAAVAELAGARVVHRRVPVRALTWAWNRWGWPPVEWLAGPAEVVHSPSPLIVPSRHGARVITIHDLDFLSHPEHVEAEMRRDFPRLACAHAHRADQVIVVSHHVASEVERRLGVSTVKITVCSPGAPSWAADIVRDRKSRQPRTIVFIGTIEPRKNVGTLLDAYARLLQKRPDAPRLVLAGRIRPSAERQLVLMKSEPLASHVTALGYVSDAQRRDLYRDAVMLVLVSLDEGFGLPVLEAMACGIPVVISNRGSLPEIAGDAATPVDATDAEAIADAMRRLLDPEVAAAAMARGIARAGRYSWDGCASAARAAYQSAIENRNRRAATPVTRAGEAF